MRERGAHREKQIGITRGIKITLNRPLYEPLTVL